MNLLTLPNINFVWGHLIIEELTRCGVKHFFLAPGSRCAPLTVAVADNPRAEKLIHYDERGIGFYALGAAAALRRPVAIICTSGTAVANFYPAVIEASKKKLPLIVLTADRPPELRQTGAMQTIDQTGIFGSYARMNTELPCPTKDIPAPYVLTTVDHAVHRSLHDLSGPVHLNCQFREPLAPIQSDDAPLTNYVADLRDWAKGKDPYTSYAHAAAGQLDPERLRDIVAILQKVKKGVIVLGKLNSDDERSAVLSLSQRLNWPIFPDISSGLRLGNKQRNVIHFYDQIFLSKKFYEHHIFDGILHLGGRITSKRWYQMLEQMKPKHYVMVLGHPLRNDPLHCVTLRVQANIQDFCEQVRDEFLPRKDRTDIQDLKKASRLSDLTLDKQLSKDDGLNEPVVSRLIAEHIPKQSLLFLANSMPIREMDMFASANHHEVRVEGNRGASGIDGTIATGTGFASAIDKPVTILTGDLALLHDLNSLALVKSCSQPVVIVVINNNGGGIFSFLPIAEFSAVFERYFGTPHQLNFVLAAQMFGIHYANPKTQQQFVADYSMPFVRKKSTLIEVTTDRMQNYKLHESLSKQISTAIDQVYI